VFVEQENSKPKESTSACDLPKIFANLQPEGIGIVYRSPPSPPFLTPSTLMESILSAAPITIFLTVPLMGISEYGTS